MANPGKNSSVAGVARAMVAALSADTCDGTRAGQEWRECCSNR